MLFIIFIFVNKINRFLCCSVPVTIKMEVCPTYMIAGDPIGTVTTEIVTTMEAFAADTQEEDRITTRIFNFLKFCRIFSSIVLSILDLLMEGSHGVVPRWIRFSRSHA